MTDSVATTDAFEVEHHHRESGETPRGFVRAMLGHQTVWFGPVSDLRVVGLPQCPAGTVFYWHPIEFTQFRQRARETASLLGTLE